MAIPAGAVEFTTLMVIQEGNKVTVNAELKLDEAQLNDLKSGINKELIFYVDLFRAWELWPDEFITGIKIYRTIKSDPVKKEFILESAGEYSGGVHRFNTLESLLDRSLKIDNLHAFTTDRQERGSYFVKVTAVSQIRKLAPIVGYLLFFVPEKEFSVTRRSEPFTAGRLP